MGKVLITGASRGIGKAIADCFLENGYDVFLPTRKELDLSSASSIESFINQYKDVAFDIIVNNAGVNDINTIENVTDEELDNMLAVNLVAPVKILRGMIPGMKKRQKGKIVNIGSIWGVTSKSGRSIYSATKHAIHGLTVTLAVELASDNILVNTVCPGYTLTELTKKNNTDSQIAEISKDIPLGRMAAPKEIAEVVYFLCSKQNTYLTGQRIVVDGGFTVQ